MNSVLRLAWRNPWRQPRRTWLTTGAMVFSNALLIFMMSLQFGTYELMIDNSLAAFTGQLQVQAPGYIDDSKMRQSVPDIEALAAVYRSDTSFEYVAARAAAFALASSNDRSYGIRIFGVEPIFEPGVSNVPNCSDIMKIRDDNVLLEHHFYDQDGELVKGLVTLDVGEMGGRTVATRQRMNKVDFRR